MASQEALRACYRFGGIAELYSGVFAGVIDLPKIDVLCPEPQSCVQGGNVALSISWWDDLVETKLWSLGLGLAAVTVNEAATKP